jgi:hypothetical protein
MIETKKPSRVLKNIFIFIAGFVTAIILMVIIGYGGEAPSNSSLRQGLTLFQEQGNPINETQFKVFQVIESNLALANARDSSISSSISSSLTLFTGLTVLLMGSEGKHFYDDEVIVFSSNPNQVGSYQYESQRGRRTVPVIRVE